MNILLCKNYQPDRQELVISRDKILRSLEVPFDDVDPFVEDLIHELSLQSLDICEPRSCFALFGEPLFPDKSTMLLEEQTFSLGKIITSAVKLSSHIALFVGTAGSRVELLSKELFSHGNSLEGLIVNLIGSEIAESVALSVHRRIGEEMMKTGLNITNRYSPGYCGWPVSDQQVLFRLMNGNTCGVQLTPTSLMLPIKSVSGIVGAGKQVKKRGYSCSKCEEDFCIYRDKSGG
jgi:hypothetical protein